MISTHVLDTARGRPASGVPVTLEAIPDADSPAAARLVARAATDDDGRVRALATAGESLTAGRYRLTFDTSVYFEAIGAEAFYPLVAVVFTVRDPSQHYHVPLLLSPFGYSTYRGS